MIWVVFVMLFTTANADFLEMVDTQTKQGYTWEYVGRTVVTDEVALPAVEQDDTKVYYWYLTEPTK